MMTFCNIARGVSATRWVVMALIAMTLWGHAGHAQRGHETAGPPAGSDAKVPEMEAAIDAFLRCRGWLRSMAPANFDDPRAHIGVPGCAGVSIMLRRNGEVLGQGAATAEEPAYLRRALSRAMASALAAPVVEGLPEAVKDQLGRNLTLDMEFAGALAPVAGRSTSAVGKQLVPGLDGLAMRWQGDVAMRYPGVAIARNTASDLSRQLPGMAFDLGLPAASLETLRRTHGVRIATFRTRRLVEPEPNGVPFEPFRGKRLLRDRVADPVDVESFADGLTGHLLASIMTDSDGEADEGPTVYVSGDYQAAYDGYEPVVAGTRDQLLIAEALLHYAACDGADAEQARRASEAANQILNGFARTITADDAAEPTAVAAAAFLRAALVEGAAGEPVDEAVPLARRRLLAVAEPDQLDVPPGEAEAGSAPSPSDLAAMASGLARIAVAHGAEDDAAAAAWLADRAWASLKGRQRIELLPWIAWAERDLQEAGIDRPHARDRLRRLLEMLDDSWIGPGGLEGAPDVQGGFALEAAPTALADAQSTRPAIFIAMALDWDGLLDVVEAAVLSNRHRFTMQFLRQLQVKDEDLWDFGNQKRAMGGVRSAPWRNDLPKAAQAMALLAACKTLDALAEPGHEASAGDDATSAERRGR